MPWPALTSEQDRAAHLAPSARTRDGRVFMREEGAGPPSSGGSRASTSPPTSRPSLGRAGLNEAAEEIFAFGRLPEEDRNILM